MGRLLYELGRLDEKTRRANERGSDKIGKAVSAGPGASMEPRKKERGKSILMNCKQEWRANEMQRNNMDIALQTLETPHRQITVLDAPGHKDFIPNMISGEFESGFQRGGQTREHLLLVRSLGVSQVIVAVNKLDQVCSSRGVESDRYDEICSELRPFLTQSGFQPSKTAFVPVGAMQGVNLVGLDEAMLRKWYKGPTWSTCLVNKLVPPFEIYRPLTFPYINVFKRQSSGVVQVGEKLRVLPGDETAVVKSIELEDASVPWAASGSVPLATLFTARIIVFDIQVPITAGASVELFHHSRDVSATTVKLISVIDRASGKVLKANPRVLTKGVSAEVQIALRNTQVSGTSQTARGIPLEPFSSNKDMGRILIRRGGETIAAGMCRIACNDMLFSLTSFCRHCFGD
ncbi:P-loop containing nucleoside triphosphate hydrolase protein [Flammula alnicola]|nr:P-loop containing nucleoside triphosphate hydrolase protein [Flammula alnicola]